MTLTDLEPIDGRPGVPLGTSFLPEGSRGVKLEPAGYVEQEFLVTGDARDWQDDDGAAVPAGQAGRFVTRVLVRRPADPARFNGTVHVEPLHPDYDQALTWRTVHPHVLRTGAAWVGVTQDHRMVPVLAEHFDPLRYAGLRIDSFGHRFDIVGSVVAGLRGEATSVLTELAPVVQRVLLSGWSYTGSFCRVFLADGFHDRCRLPGGRPAVDGYLIGISSGAAGESGYPPLTADAARVASDDPRRTIGGHDVPVIELLSEFESETHAPAARADSDAAGDRYRLYQVAGTSHDSPASWGLLTNHEQCRARGLDVPRCRIVEQPSRARMDVVGRGAYAALERWVRDDEPPLRGGRLEFTGRPENELARDADGNVLGGIRPPWITAPAATYSPHSTPATGFCEPSPWAPMGTPEMVAGLIANQRPFPPHRLAELYGDPAGYLAAYDREVTAFADDWHLADADRQLLTDLAEREAATWRTTAHTERNISA